MLLLYISLVVIPTGILITCGHFFTVQITLMKESIVRIEAKLDSKLDLMEAKLDSKLDLIMMEIKSYHHDYLTNKASLLRRTNSQLISGSDSATTHALFYAGSVFTITVKHFSLNDRSNNITYLHHPDYDFSIQLGCPFQAFALNASVVDELRMGDIASCLGYVNGYERFWSGALVGKYGSKEFVVQVMGHNILVHEDEYIIDAPQLHGMSGAAVINGLYYTGCVHVAHRLGRDHYTSLSSVVIPAMHIINFAKLHFDKLSSLSSCPGTTVLQVIV